jgi:hypothetical protein
MATKQLKLKFPTTRKKRTTAKRKKSVCKIENKGLLRARISKQAKTIKTLESKLKKEKTKEKTLKKKLTKVRRTAKVVKRRIVKK